VSDDSSVVSELVLLQQEYVRDISHGLKCNSHTRDVNNISLPFTLDSMLIHSLRIIGFFGKVNNEVFYFFEYLMNNLLHSTFP